MLYIETVEPNTLALLKKLMQFKELHHFVLVGGTALSLKFGHRKSVDIDLFGGEVFDNQELKDFLSTAVPSFTSSSSNKAPGVFGYLDGVKADFVKYHHYTYIRPVENIDGIRFMSTEDIAAMKIFAILQRAKKKDFWDLSLLLDIYGVQKIIEFYFEKFPNNQTLITIPQAILFFDEAEEDEEPVSLKGQTWNAIKKNIQNHVNNFLK
ncbi:MAG: nucleotidyl transferase AbiEii/AbiGii toxin family protein [Chitinophagaceae bacterium]|nr:nucleotidyl transferase AbiEii/AbiGii toxin family protein [Chitinophagaceae bacterium]